MEPVSCIAWLGLFTRLEPDPVGVMLETGFMQFDSPFGISGLVKPFENRLDFLAVVSNNPGKGHFRLFMEQAKQRCDVVCVWEDWNPVIGDALKRYGFERVSQTEADGEVITGWRWNRPNELP